MVYRFPPPPILQSKGRGEDQSQEKGAFRFPDQHNPLRPFLLKMDVAETICIITMLFRYAGVTAIKPELPQYSIHNSYSQKHNRVCGQELHYTRAF